MTKSRQSANLVSRNNIFSDVTNSRVGIGTTLPTGKLQITSGPVIVGSGNSTGTESQPLQVSGGGYFAGVGVATGSIGVGITNPQGAIDIRTSPQWSAFNYGANLIIGGSRNNGLGILDATNSNPWAVVNSSGSLLFAQMPALGNTASATNEAARITTNRNLLISSNTETGTASQRLQVTGGAYVSGNLGVGITNPTEALDVNGARIFHRLSGINTVEFGYGAGSGDTNIYGLYVPSGKTLQVYSNAQFAYKVDGANLLINSTTSTGTASQPLQVTGGVYVSGSVGIGTTRPTSKFQVVGGDSEFEGVIETVGTATTYMIGSGMVLEMDVRRATVYTYTMPTGANIGIVSFKNMPAQTGSATGSTVTLLVTQNAAGTGNTTAATGIGTNCTVVGYENGASVAGISTRGLVGSGTTVTLSSTGGDVDFVSFFINYNGASNTAASSYKVYITKNGGFRRGTIGI